MAVEWRERLASRAACEIKEGMLVNLGIGIPSLVPNHLPKHIQVFFHAENGIVGMGPSPKKGEEDENLCNAGGFPVTLMPGGCYADSSIAFGMIRRGKIDLTILGALQVSERGDLANWIVPGRKVPGMGGAMELAQKSKRVVVLMEHTDKNGKSKLVKSCTLPLTSPTCVDLIITTMGVFEVNNQSLYLKEIFPPYTVHDIETCTEADFKVDVKE